MHRETGNRVMRMCQARPNRFEFSLRLQCFFHYQHPCPSTKRHLESTTRQRRLQIYHGTRITIAMHPTSTPSTILNPKTTKWPNSFTWTFWLDIIKCVEYDRIFSSLEPDYVDKADTWQPLPRWKRAERGIWLGLQHTSSTELRWGHRPCIPWNIYPLMAPVFKYDMERDMWRRTVDSGRIGRRHSSRKS